MEIRKDYKVALLGQSNEGGNMERKLMICYDNKGHKLAKQKRDIKKREGPNLTQHNIDMYYRDKIFLNNVDETRNEESKI